MLVVVEAQPQVQAGEAGQRVAERGFEIQAGLAQVDDRIAFRSVFFFFFLVIIALVSSSSSPS